MTTAGNVSYTGACPGKHQTLVAGDGGYLTGEL